MESIENKSNNENFKKYGSIENHDNDIMKKFQAHFPSEVWIALEKVHGSNMSFIIQQNEANECELKIAKRTTILSTEEETTFYNCVLIKDKYESSAIEFFKHIKSLKPTLKSLHIFGEYFGGRYKDDTGKIIAEHGSKYPQKDIKYCPQNEFIIFDVYSIDENPTKNCYMNYDTLIEYCIAYNLKYLPILHTGTLSEMLALNPSFPTTIPKLVECDIGNEDEAEGLVIKTIKTMYLPGRSNRAIFKYKALAFREKNGPVKVRAPRKEVNVSEETRELANIAESYVTRARLAGKLTSLPDRSNTRENIQKITGVLVGDVVAELKRDGHTFEDKQSRHYITSIVMEASQELVKCELLTC